MTKMKEVFIPGLLCPPKPLETITPPSIDQRITVAKDKWGFVSFGWMWMVRDADGQAVGFGFEEDKEERYVRKRAAICWLLTFEEPLPAAYAEFANC